MIVSESSLYPSDQRNLLKILQLADNSTTDISLSRSRLPSARALKLPISEIYDGMIPNMTKKYRIETQSEIENDLSNTEVVMGYATIISNRNGVNEDVIAPGESIKLRRELVPPEVRLSESTGSEDKYYGAGSVPVRIGEKRSKNMVSVLGIEMDFGDDHRASSLYAHRAAVMRDLINGAGVVVESNSTECASTDVNGTESMEEVVEENIKSNSVHHVSPDSNHLESRFRSIVSKNNGTKNSNRPYYRPPQGYTYRTNINNLPGSDFREDDDITEEFFMFEI